MTGKARTAAPDWLDLLTEEERELVATLDTPRRVQGFIDTLAYSADHFYRAPLRAFRERTGHCYDGAVLAAALLRRLGHPPLLLEMLPNDRDDDHVLALFRLEGHWGAIAKSNFVGLRYREPIHRTLRELVLSYFEQYYNLAREKTLRGYTPPLDLSRFDAQGWTVRDEAMEVISDRQDRQRRYWLLSEQMVAALAPVDPRSYEAGLQGSVAEGLFQPDGTTPPAGRA